MNTDSVSGSVEVDSHENVPDAQAFSDVGTSSSCGNRGEAMGAEATMASVPPVPDEASSDSHSGVESSRTVSTACDSAPAAGDHGNVSGTSDQPSQSETGGGFSTASAAEEPVESGNNAEEVYELLICDSEASEGITSVMVDSVSSTVIGAQRGAGPSPSTYHLVSLPSCSSSGPSTSVLSSHRLTTQHTSTLRRQSSSLSSSSGQPIVADSSAGLPSHDSTAASNSNVDDSETYENGAASASSSACDGTSSEIVVYAEEEATASVTVLLDNCDDDSSNNTASEDASGHGHGGHGGLANGVPDEQASTVETQFCTKTTTPQRAQPFQTLTAVVGNVVTVETVRDVVEQVVTSSASVTPASLSQPSTVEGHSRGHSSC
ncbi:hypothetical protein HPB52_005846 [Rhipicephalus sanguineus]|uniref:Uncharacterized protein n=1 Tax=Rhipicephalus sanguineus TaxID=34632 RepID=A0A9D4PYG4_RHISA|nr:hypothetical protein HPB52_005846 [Rhipicephalus sanguineus]